MMVFLKKLHKWVGLIIGIQALLWLSSGLMISVLDPLKVSGREWSLPVSTETTSSLEALLGMDELPVELIHDALGIDLKTIRGEPVYQFTHPDGPILINARSGLEMKTSEQEAGQLARRDFKGDGEIVSIEKGIAPNLATRDHNGPYWRVNFSDASDTSYYLSESSGEIWERRNNFWRVRDFFWMLHIMDYAGREDLNNTLVIIIALISIWLGLSGFLLLFYSFNRHDFWFLNLTGKRDEATITLIDPDFNQPQNVRIRKGSNLFMSLATHGVDLPSICGGGGECGKCRVKTGLRDFPSANQLEQGLLPGRLRERGYRLACQLMVSNNATIHVPAGTLSANGEASQSSL